MPDNQEQPAEEAAPAQAPAAQATPAPLRETNDDVSPIIAVRNAILNSGNATAQTVREIDCKVRDALNFECPSPEEKGLVDTCLTVGGNTVSATAGNVCRRAVEIAEPAGNICEAATSLTIGNALQPINTVMHPIQRILKPITKIGTSLLKGAARILKAPIKIARDIIDRGFANNIEQAGLYLGKLPLVGGLFSRLGGFLSKLTKGTARLADDIQDTVTKPIEVVDDAVKLG